MIWPLLAALIGGAGLFAVTKRKKTPTSGSLSPLPSLQVRPPAYIMNALRAAAAKYDVSLDILVGVAHTESRFNPRAVSPVGAMGLMQLMPVVIRTYGIKDPFDPVENAMGAARFLSKYYKKYGDWGKTLAAYNWGPGNVNNNPLPSQWPPQTQTYVARATRVVA